MNEFVIDNVNISDVDFEDVSIGHGECFGQQQNYQFRGEIYGDDFGHRGNYVY